MSYQERQRKLKEKRKKQSAEILARLLAAAERIHNWPAMPEPPEGEPFSELADLLGAMGDAGSPGKVLAMWAVERRIAGGSSSSELREALGGSVHWFEPVVAECLGNYSLKEIVRYCRITPRSLAIASGLAETEQVLDALLRVWRPHSFSRHHVLPVPDGSDWAARFREGELKVAEPTGKAYQFPWIEQDIRLMDGIVDFVKSIVGSGVAISASADNRHLNPEIVALLIVIGDHARDIQRHMEDMPLWLVPEEPPW